MATRSYLDALTPGMRAKLDPLSRITREQRAARWPSAVKGEADITFPKYNLGPVERYKRRQESRTRVAGF